jgi:hypothetical protein
MERPIMDDFEKEALLNDSLRGRAMMLSGWQGTLPPASRHEAGIECITQFIRLGPRVPKTLSSYETCAMLYLLQLAFVEPLLEYNLWLLFPDFVTLAAPYGG